MTRDPLEMVNAHDLMRATGFNYARPVTGRGRPGWAWGGQEFHEPAPGGDCWEAMTAFAGIDRWVTPTGIGGWWPFEIIEKAKALGLHRREGRKLAWREGRPCDETITGDWTSHRCERVAAGERKLGGLRGQDGRGTLVVCSMHQKVAEKREAQSAEISANIKESMERSRRAAEHRKLAEEFLEWAGPLLAELGIHPKTVTAGTVGDRSGILLPTEAVATLIQEATGERYPGRPSDEADR